jgi:hypothetical protein
MSTAGSASKTPTLQRTPNCKLNPTVTAVLPNFRGTKNLATSFKEDEEIFASFLLFYLFTRFTFFQKSKNFPALLKESRQPPRTARTPELCLLAEVWQFVRGSLEHGSDF